MVAGTGNDCALYRFVADGVASVLSYVGSDRVHERDRGAEAVARSPARDLLPT